MKKFAIIGFGCAGYNGAKAIRAHDGEAAIHVFDHSGAPPFNPMLSTYHASGKLPYDAVFPFGTPEEIRATVNKYLDMVGPKGGLMICPTHMLEPEVPIENVIAYIEACRDYVVKK